MSRRLSLVISVFAAGALGLSGCQHCHKSCPPPQCVPSPLPAPPAGVVAPPAAVTAPVPVPQPAPAAGAVPAPPPNWTPPAAATPPGVRNYAPPSTTWQPAESQVRLVPPQEPPQTAQAAPPAGVEEKRTSEPPVADTQGSPSPALPVGIAQFAYARGQIATGLRPMLEGFDWLQAQGYKTVLNVHKPGEDDAADRRMFEKRGMKYLSLEVSPQTLGKGTVDTFNRIVEESERPLFVYDRDGVLAGGLWYLHFRTAGKLSDEEARSRAGRLGLKTDADGDARTMWVAIQKLLSEQQ